MNNSSDKFDISNRVFYLLVAMLAGVLIFWGFRAVEIWKTTTGSFPREISVEGTGKAYVVPDVAELTVGVTTEAKTSDEAVTENTKKVNEVMKTLADLGVKKEDIKTVSYYLNPKYNWTEAAGSVQDGYVLDQSLLIKIRAFDKVGEVISKTTAAGANIVSGVQFTVDDLESAKAQARTEAVEKAMAKAKQIAEATHMRLGKIVSFYEYANDYYPPMPYSATKDMAVGATPEMMEMSSPSIEPGQQEVTLTVTLGYRVY